MTCSRRTFLAASAASAAALVPARHAAAAENERTLGLGFSLYGMRSLSLADGLKTCAEIGYDCVELPVMADWPGDTAKLDREARADIRRQLNDTGLRLTALMENLPALVDEQKHAANLERLKLAGQLAQDLAGGEGKDAPPLVETVLGGKPGEFDAVKSRLIERLGDWAEAMAQAKVVLAIKAHVSNAIQRPEQLLAVLDGVGSPWLKAAYDYSHFQLQGLELAKTLKELAARSVFIHVKDSQPAGEKWRFALPGEGSIDYGEYFQLLAKSEYRGDVVVEVSGQVFSQPGYDPVAAARKCYNHLAPAMKNGGITRG